ncbi:MAG: hypothetical protein LC126_06565 [Bryobacterales bacterium]|nr:hypothetical protein [Bryobacterales bacterium]
MRSICCSILLLKVAGLSFAAASDQITSITPTTTVNLRTTVALRETVAAAIIGDNKLSLLITDQAPTGRSGILLQMDATGANQKWTDLKVPADDLVIAGSFVAALAPVHKGLRVLQSVGGGVQSTDLTGMTAVTVGSSSRLIRLLASGDLAVHDLGVNGIAPPRVLPMATVLKVPEACAKCGAAKFVGRWTYAVCPLPGDRLAVVQRSSGNLKILDLNNSKVTLTTLLNGDDITRGKKMYANYQEKIRVAGGEDPLNPSLVLAIAAHASGDMFLLVGPFAPVEGARVIRVNSNGAVIASLRCAYPAFDAQYGAPQFIGLNGDDLYLVTSRGLINIYRLHR